ISDAAVVPYMVKIVVGTLRIDEAVREAVRALVEVAIGLQESALTQYLAGGIFDGEVHPRFVHVALLGYMAMRNAFVLDHHIGRQPLTGSDLERHETQRRRNCVRLRSIVRIAMFQSE